MKSTIKQLTEKFKAEEKAESAAKMVELQDPTTSNRGWDFLKKSLLGGLGLGGMMMAPIEDVMAHTTSRVSRLSNPSDLKITDLTDSKDGYPCRGMGHHILDLSHHHSPQTQ